MMKKITKSLLAVALSLMLLAVLPVSALASEAPQKQASLSYNAEYFIKSGTRFNKNDHLEVLYNGSLMPSMVNITGVLDSAVDNVKQSYEFSFSGNIYNENENYAKSNDVLEISSAASAVSLSGADGAGVTKYIGIIANASGTDSVNADFKIIFEDGTSKATNVTINSMFTQGATAYSYGAALTPASLTSSRWTYSGAGAATYFNLIELETNTISKITSIEFGAASSPYHIIGVVEVGYTQSELDYLTNQLVGQDIPLFVGDGTNPKQSITDIDADEAAKLQTIVSTIGTQYADYGVSQEDYTYLTSLLEAYTLYIAQTARKTTYDNLAAVYLTYTLSDIYADKDNSAAKLADLQKLLDLYNEQEELDTDQDGTTDKAELIALMDWSEFAMDSADKDIFVSLDTAKYNEISELIADYPAYEDQMELQEKIKLFDSYKDKKISDLTDGDVDTLNELIGYYDEIDKLIEELTESGDEDKIFISYDAADRAYIEKLKDSYVKYQNSENNYHYDLTNYFNRGIVANAGDAVHSSWGTSNTVTIGGVKYRTGISKDHWDGTIGASGVVTAKSYINYKVTDTEHSPALTYYKTLTSDFPTFKVSTASDADDKNAVVFNSNSITLKGSGRMAKTLDLLSLGSQNNGNPRIDINITYTDGTTQNQDIIVIWYGYNAQSFSSKLPTYGDTAETYELINKNGVAAQEKGGPRFAFRAYSIPLQQGKIVDEITIKRKSGPEAILVSLSEQVVDNQTFQDKFISLYNEVKEFDEESSDKAKETTFYYYCVEAQNRGIDFSMIEDQDGNKIDNMSVIEEILAETLVADANISKTDKEEVTAVLEFSQPVDKAALEANMKVEKKNADGAYEDAAVNEITMSADSKTATIKIADPLLGGVDYLVSIGEDLTATGATKKIARAYEFSYSSFAWINFDVITAFEKADMNTVKAKISFTHSVDTAKLADSIKVSKGGSVLQADAYTLSDITPKSVVVTLADSPSGKSAFEVVVSSSLQLGGEYSGYSIGKSYTFSHTSSAYLTSTALDAGSTTVTNNTTEATYKYRVVSTEIATDGTDILSSYDSGIVTAAPLSSQAHSLGYTSTGSLFASIWDENQKFIGFIGDTAVKATASDTPEEADYKKPTLDTNKVLKIAGFTPSKEKDKNITLEIFRTAPEVNSGNPKSFMKTQGLTNSDGYFEIVVELNDSIMTDSDFKSGSLLTFSLGGDDFATPLTSEIEAVYYSTTKQVKETIQSIIDAADTAAVESILNSEAVYNQNILQLPAAVYKATGYDMSKLAALIVANKALLSADTNSNVQSSLTVIRKLTVLNAFNQGIKDAVAKDGSLLYDDIMGYSTAIDVNGATLYSLYGTLLNSTGKDLLVDYLTTGKSYTTVDTLIADIKNKLFYLELEYPSDDSGAYVSDILTYANLAQAGILGLPNYFVFSDKSGINTAIANAAITDLASLNSAIDAYYAANYVDGGGDSGSSGSGFSSGSSSVSSFGADKAYLDDISNNTSDDNSGTIFRDVSKNHWAYNYISELYDKDIISGKGNGLFAPEDGLTRAELVKIIVAAENLKPNGAAIPFTDVSADSWYLPYVQAAYSNGIIAGVTENTFAPEQMISRQDLCVVLYRLLSDKTTGEISFSDSSSIAAYALDAVKCFVNKGIINGFEDGSFRPNDGCTRAQCAKIISMFLQK